MGVSAPCCLLPVEAGDVGRAMIYLILVSATRTPARNYGEGATTPGTSRPEADRACCAFITVCSGGAKRSASEVDLRPEREAGMRHVDMIRAGGLPAGARVKSRRPPRRRRRSAAEVMLCPIVRLIDAYLRRCYHVLEYTDDPGCILRIAITAARQQCTLDGGIVIAPGDPLIELHLWNEHLPRMRAAGPDIGWASLVNRELSHSLALLADYLRAHPALTQAKALHGRIRFFRCDQEKIARFADHVGFELLPQCERAHENWVDRLTSHLATWAFERVFNPAARHDSARVCLDVWMSRQRLMMRYGSPPSRLRVFFGRAARTRS